METERLLALSMDAATAKIVLQHMEKLFAHERTNTINELKGLYREGNQDLARMQATVGQLVCIDNLEEHLKMQIRRGDKAQKEIQNGR